MALEYISDSDDLPDVLDTSMLSPRRMASLLSRLPHDQREIATNNLRIRYLSLFSTNEWHNPSLVESRTVNSASQTDTTMNIDQRDTSNQTDSLINIDHTELDENPHIRHHPHSSHNALSVPDEHDNTNLKLYLDARNYETSRRGLRKRNFASTHPYLADQVHYLGLTSINYLNELYGANQDLELIVKFLNYSYVRLKQSNPKDEKYKSKNFYTILGMQSQIARMKEQQSQQDNQKEDTSQIASQALSDHSDDFSDSSDSQIKDTQPFTNYDDLSDLQSSESSEDDDTLVRVGGRYVKERNLLRGTLPESAKRLDLYKKPARSYNKSTRKHIEQRRGLAIKKKASGRPQSSTLLNELNQFVDVNNDQDDIHFYKKFDTSHEVMSDFDTPLKSIDTFGILSESSEEEFENFAQDFLKTKERGSIEPLVHDTPIDIGSEVEEEDEINPMFSYGTTYKKRRTNKESTSRVRKSPGARPERPEPTPGSSMPRKVSRPVKRPISNHPRSAIGSYPRKRSTPTFGNLQKKKATFPKSKKKPRTLKKLGNPIPRELLKSSYTFLRSPAQYTIAFEAESEDKFVKNTLKPVPVRHETVQSIIGEASFFPYGFILNSIDIKRIWQINEGKSYNFTSDTVSISLMNDRYLFTLLDPTQARTNLERLFVSILKLLKDGSFDQNQLYDAIKGILSWTLICKEAPSEKVWKHCRNCLALLSQRSFDVGKSKLFYPYFILIHYTFASMAKLTLQPVKEESFLQLCLKYWILFFFHGSFAMERNTKEYESFSIMYTILNLHKRWWELIDSVMDQITCEVDLEIVLEILASLAPFVPHHKWTILYLIYSKISIEDSQTHHSFMDLIMLLNQRYSWPLEEKLLLLLYGTITVRKFSNFEDEYGVPELLAKIHTRNDIPDTTFFERFMYLFYNYVSELPTTANKKRLITKLITSSHYQYKQDRAHFGMFVNRLNFLLLLQQVSEVDLKNQLYDLLQRIVPSNDAEILMISVQALHLFVERSLVTSLGLAVNCFVLLANKIMASYFEMPGAVKIWKLMINILEKLITINSFQVLDIARTIDAERIEVQRLILRAIEAIELNEFSTKQLEILLDNYERNYKILHSNMARIPLPSVTEEAKLDETIELGFKIWIKTSHLLPNINWDFITLQRFPYTGNTQLREKFILFFYIELLRYTSLKNCKDNILKAVLRNTVSFTPSKYTPQILNQLNKEKNEVILFQRKFIPEEVTPFFLVNFRLQMVSNILMNLSKSPRTEMVTKRIYIEEALKTVNAEYDKYFSSSWYKDFCIGVIKAIQKYCRDIISDSELVRSTASKLGVLQHELDKYNWLSKPLKQRLSFLHEEFVNALHFQKDYASVLRSYTFAEGTDMIYHLISIYSKAVMMHQSEKWRLLQVLLDFYSQNLSLFKFDIFNISFKKFLRLVVDIPKLPKPSRNSDKYHRLKVCHSVGAILDISVVLFDGYKDIDFVQGSINSFLDNFEADPSAVTFYSPFKMFDIQDVRREMVETGLEVSTEEVEELQIQLEIEKDKLRRKVALSELVTDKCLQLDLHF